VRRQVPQGGGRGHCGRFSPSPSCSLPLLA
jgi:hypothetical protein